MSAEPDVLLIVEDNPDDLHLLLRACKKAGVSVPIRTAADGREAISYLDELSQDNPGPRLLAVLLDLKLPGFSGFEVLKTLKSRPLLRRTPVVVLTSSSESRDVAQAYDLGANSYLLKPAQPAALVSMMAMIQDYWLGLNVRP
ncbi:MAG: response regulator [Proteobacteria bacterium]|nr:response regulator [Pseudomonadota bacterium]